MQIFITSIGTRGDIEPFLSVGDMLHKQGHQITYAFPEQFSQLVPKANNHFPLSPKIIDLIQSEEGQTVMGKANIFAKLKALIYLYKQGKTINKEITYQHHKAFQHTRPDIIIHNTKCSFPFIWGLKHNISTVLLSPVPYLIHSVKHHAHIGFNQNYGHYLNQLTYKLANFGLVKSIYDIQNTILGTPLFSKKEIHQDLITKKIAYCISPNLFNPPTYWPDNAKVYGQNHKIKSELKSPKEDIEQFLKTHEKPVFLSFGSMQNNEPNRISNFLYAVFEKLQIPVIVNLAEKGLVKTDPYRDKDGFLFVDEIPYDWIMPKVYAVVHHGGSGTTHAGIRYSCPTLIIPHIIDQYAWNTLIHDLRIGPLGKSINRLTESIFEKLLTDLYQNTTYKTNVVELSKAINKENYKKELLDFITA